MSAQLGQAGGGGPVKRAIGVGVVFLALAFIATSATDMSPVAAQPTQPGTTGTSIPVIVTYADGVAPAGARTDQLVRDLGARYVRDVVPFADVPAASMRVDATRLANLARQPGVVDVALNRTLRPLASPSTADIGAPSAWDRGLTGEGQAVAIIDTGVDTTHPMLAGKVVAEACFTPVRPDGSGGGYCGNGLTTAYGPGAAAPCTGGVECGHGTHVASVAAGNGDGRQGVAPGAALVAVQVFSSAAKPTEGVGTDEASVIRALEWVYSLRSALPIAAVNLSLGGDPLPTPCGASAALVSIVDRLTAAGTAVVAAAGNDGSNTRLSFPACLPGVVSVGSAGTASRVSSFSNSAATLSLVAPGEGIVGAWTGPCCYRSASGTSFAAPHVSGALAVLRQQLGPWPVASLVALLDRTGDPVYLPYTGDYLLAGSIRLDRAIQPDFQVQLPAPLAQGGPPLGWVDTVSGAPGGVRVQGWALDGDVVSPLTVHVYVDGAFAASAVAGARRPDIAAAFPGYGPDHGYDLTVPVAAGTHDVCIYGIDAGAGPGNVLLRCVRAVTGWVTGALDAAVPEDGGVRVAGWALDTKQLGPTTVHVYVDDRFAASFDAPLPRPDIAAAFPGFGADHGFVEVVPADGGDHRVCAYAIDSGGRDNPLLGCVRVRVPSRSPFGALDAVSVAGGVLRVNGWAIDPDTNAPIDVHVYVDEHGVPFLADDARPDIAAAFAGFGASHGFSAELPVAPGVHRVCAYGINVGAGQNALLGCRTIS